MYCILYVLADEKIGSHSIIIIMTIYLVHCKSKLFINELFNDRLYCQCPDWVLYMYISSYSMHYLT